MTPSTSPERPENPEAQTTVGGPWLPATVSEGPLFAGPPEDPDRYELQDAGTRGGEGRTWRANYRGGLNKPLAEAVKMLFPPANRVGPWPDPDDLRRWRDNAALLRHLAQPHVVQLHDIFAGDFPHPAGRSSSTRSTAYLTMEWVEGPTLAEYVNGKPVTAATLDERLRYINEIASAVASLHSYSRSSGNPVLHRDLTPANCIVHADRGIVLIDIGGMRLIDDGFDPLGRHTPAYTAPEVLRAPNAPRDPSSDLYAVGAVAVYALTGRPEPEPGPALQQRLTQLFAEAGVNAAEPMAAHLIRMLEEDPSRRPSDLLAWSRTLTALAVDAPPAKPRSRTFGLLSATAAGLAAVLAVGVGVYVANRDDTPSTPAPSVTTSAPATATLGPVREASEGLSPNDFFSASGRIISPVSEAPVRDCEYFTGTAAKLPPGQTLVVSQHNRSEPGTARYLQVTYGFDHPEQLTTWRTAQYFNPQSVGQSVIIELIQLPLTPALVQADDQQDYEASSAMAGRGKVLAAVTVKPVGEKNPAFPCPGPP